MRSNYTSRQSAKPASRGPLQSLTRASRTSKSGDFKAVHLDRAALNLTAQSKENNENVASATEASTGKHQGKKEKKNRHNTGNNYNSRQHIQGRRQYAHNSSMRPTTKASCHGASANLLASENCFRGHSRTPNSRTLLPSQGSSRDKVWMSKSSTHNAC